MSAMMPPDGWMTKTTHGRNSYGKKFLLADITHGGNFIGKLARAKIYDLSKIYWRLWLLTSPPLVKREFMGSDLRYSYREAANIMVYKTTSHYMEDPTCFNLFHRDRKKLGVIGFKFNSHLHSIFFPDCHLEYRPFFLSNPVLNSLPLITKSVYVHNVYSMYQLYVKSTSSFLL